jgi:protein TonB
MEQMARPPEPPVTIDAQIIEQPAPVKPVIAPKKPMRKVMPKTSPPKLPAPIQQPTVSPAVSLPEIKSPPSSLTTPFGGIAPVVQSSNPKPSVQGSGGSGETVTPPEFGAAYLNNPKPEYPAFARRMRMEGMVMLKVLVGRQGTALKVEVAHSSGYEILDKAAAGAVKNWRFVPAKHGDSPFDEWVQVPVAFSLIK